MLLLIASQGSAGPLSVNRFSFMHTYRGYCSLPIPDGTIAVEDRLLLLNLYRGLTPPAGAGGSMTGYVHDRDKAHDAIFKKNKRRLKRRRP